MDYEKEVNDAIRGGIREGVSRVFNNNYNNPLTKVVDEAVQNKHGEFRKLIDSAIAGCLVDEDFTSSIKVAVRQQLAKILVQKFGGELERQVNALKSDPTTRARIVLALEEIVAKTGN